MQNSVSYILQFNLLLSPKSKTKHFDQFSDRVALDIGNHFSAVACFYLLERMTDLFNFLRKCFSNKNNNHTIYLSIYLKNEVQTINRFNILNKILEKEVPINNIQSLLQDRLPTQDIFSQTRRVNF